MARWVGNILCSFQYTSPHTHSEIHKSLGFLNWLRKWSIPKKSSQQMVNLHWCTSNNFSECPPCFVSKSQNMPEMIFITPNNNERANSRVPSNYTIDRLQRIFSYNRILIYVLDNLISHQIGIYIF